MDDRLSFLRQEARASLPIPCSFQHKAPGVEGEVELMYWPAKSKGNAAPEQLTFFILGNPGLLGYYPPFLSHLHSLLPPTHALLATSHIGQSTTVASPKEPLDLPAHLESKVELVTYLRRYLDAWAQESGQQNRPKLAMMGHSVGSWLSCEVMKRLNTDKEDVVDVLYMLFPTLGWIANSWNGWKLWPVFHHPFKPLLPVLAPLLRPILHLTSLPTTSVSLVSTPSIIRHVLHLAASEMKLIQEPDLNWFRAQRVDDTKKGLYGVWASGNTDGWVGKDGPLVQECLGGEDGGRVKLLDGVPHAYCLTQEHSELVAQVVASWIIPEGSSKAVPSSTDTPSEPPTGADIIPM
ncbi:hypothetical protein CI109_101832 [Kwoniella shandongensis]|uniref:Uncharacterized protein n=1 Tax=Kwoniella shandongensis TaxID=1734106 RepID=A0A5M6C526_9TREE|nr:uncharacterized protein CI109_001046 [Kwoniella shandongensis]KAA5530246.1 hypothetical protein CI109_001046 [Kwoniella shandongensis]